VTAEIVLWSEFYDKRKDIYFLSSSTLFFSLLQHCTFTIFLQKVPHHYYHHRHTIPLSHPSYNQKREVVRFVQHTICIKMYAERQKVCITTSLLLLPPPIPPCTNERRGVSCIGGNSEHNNETREKSRPLFPSFLSGRNWYECLFYSIAVQIPVA